jgi:hypothetical protein
VLNSSIAYPSDGSVAVVQDGCISIEGYAYPNGETGCQVTNVQLSFDGGASWSNVQELLLETKDPGAKVFSWTLWRYQLPLE